jgi:hypothetical protein
MFLSGLFLSGLPSKQINKQSITERLQKAKMIKKSPTVPIRQQLWTPRQALITDLYLEFPPSPPKPTIDLSHQASKQPLPKQPTMNLLLRESRRTKMKWTMRTTNPKAQRTIP